MSKNRYAQRVDKNQKEIVEQLRSIPGVHVVTGHDDILVGRRNYTYWYEIKSERVVSKKTGKVLDSGKKKLQKQLEESFTGHYKIVSSLEEILEDMGVESAA